MRKNKIIISICAAAFVTIASMGSSFAATVESTPETTTETTTEITSAVDRAGGFGRGRVQLTEEQRAEMEARKASKIAAREKWSELTDVQKEEIYELKEKAYSYDVQIIDKYLDLGIIDEETANQMKEKLSQQVTDMKDNDRMPFPGGRGGRGRKGNRGSKGCWNAPVTEQGETL